MQATPAPRFSLIVPAHNEESYLPRLLDSVDIARARCRRGAGAVEVVVADDGSADATAAIAEQRECRVVRLAASRIAAARNAGAAVATGKVFCFVDADMRVHPETFNAIDDMLGSGRIVAGATGVTLERWSVGLAVTYALMVPWVWLLRMDTGVVFCRAADFRAVGGFDERRSFGEDVQFLVDLRRLGRRRGQRLGRARRAKAIASTRKFDRHGDWHYFMLIFRLLAPMLRSPGTRSELVEDYWYNDPAR
jgi:glycosyltransferase involved in cell wall biosynthesis